MNAPESLRAQVLDRYISVHAFCVAHPELKRSTVYMVLAGRYPGRTEKQAARIRAALAGLLRVSDANGAGGAGTLREAVSGEVKK